MAIGAFQKHGRNSHSQSFQNRRLFPIIPPPVKSLPYRCHYRCHYYRCSAVNRASCQSVPVNRACRSYIPSFTPPAPSPIATAITAVTKPALLQPLLPRPLLPLQRLAPVNRASCQSRTCQSCVLSIMRPAPSAPSAFPIATAITADTKPALPRPLLPLPLIPRPLLQLPLVPQPLVVVVIVRGAALSGCGQNDWLPGIYGCIKNLPAFSECFLIITLATCPALPLSRPLP